MEGQRDRDRERGPGKSVLNSLMHLGRRERGGGGSVWEVERGGDCAHRTFPKVPRPFPCSLFAGYGLDDGVAWISEHLRVN